MVPSPLKPRINNLASTFPTWHGGCVALTRLHPLRRAHLLVQRAVAGGGADAQLRNFKPAQNAL